MYEKILLTTDGSEGAEAAVAHAEDLAKKYGAELHILFVLDIGVDTSIGAVSDLMGELEEAGRLTELGQEAVDSIEKELDPEVDAVTHVARGVPHKEITGYADENDIDLIVMSSRGRTGLDRVLLGSVTEKVLRSSDIPVLTVKREGI
ncbi:MAG: universal stress protein [Candidatus Nanohaloarchaea archaeon]